MQARCDGSPWRSQAIVSPPIPQPLTRHREWLLLRAVRWTGVQIAGLQYNVPSAGLAGLTQSGREGAARALHVGQANHTFSAAAGPAAAPHGCADHRNGQSELRILFYRQQGDVVKRVGCADELAQPFLDILEKRGRSCLAAI